MLNDSILDSYTSNKVKMPDGSELAGDAYEHAKIVDMLASEYGLGGCRNLTEFAKMVDEEDILLVHFLLKAIGERYEEMYGNKPSDRNRNISKHINRHAPSSMNKSSTKPYNSNEAIDCSEDAKTNRNRMSMFLREMGASKDKVREAVEKINNGEIKTSSVDFSWITSEELRKPNFDTRGVLKQMCEEQKKSFNFKVSLDTLTKRK